MTGELAVGDCPGDCPLAWTAPTRLPSTGVASLPKPRSHCRGLILHHQYTTCPSDGDTMWLEGRVAMVRSSPGAAR